MPFNRNYSRYSPYARRRITQTALRRGYAVGPQYVRPSAVPRRMRTAAARVKRSRIGSRNVHHFTRWVGTAQTLSCTGTEANGVGIFQLSDLPLVSDFGNLYDRYRITHVQARVQLITNPNSVVPLNSVVPPVTQQPSNWYPKFWWCPDYDDSAAETIEDLKQRVKTKCFVLQPNKAYKINIKPACLVRTYGNIISDGYDPKWGVWIDMTNQSVAHYGYKYCIDANGENPNDSYPFKVRIEYKYWFTCKDVR